MISIIIPMYNRASLVGETLDSIVAQTYTDWECIVVDDRSTDDSVAVVQKYVDRDPRFKLMVRPEDRIKGAPTCRNIGCENSKGDIVYFFDSDDILSPEFFEAVTKVSDEHPEAEFFYAELDSFCGDYTSKKYKPHDRPPYPGTPFDNLCSFRARPSTQRLIWRRRLLESTGINWKEGLLKAQDGDFTFRVLSETENEGTWIPGPPMIHYRRHHAQMLTSANSGDKAIAIADYVENSFRKLVGRRNLTPERQFRYLKGSIKFMFVTALVFDCRRATKQYHGFMCAATSNKRLIGCVWILRKIAPLLYMSRPLTYLLRRATFIKRKIKS